MKTHPAEALSTYRKQVLDIARHYRARNVRVFGSVVREEAGYFSDVDLLVDFEPGVRLFDQIGFQQDLEDLLRCRVDVVDEKGLKATHRDRILGEAVPL